MNKDSVEYKRVREKTAEFLAKHIGYTGLTSLPRERRERFYEEADQILSTKGIVIEADDQNLPKPEEDIHTWRDYSPDMAYEKAQQDMTNFRRII